MNSVNIYIGRYISKDEFEDCWLDDIWEYHTVWVYGRLQWDDSIKDYTSEWKFLGHEEDYSRYIKHGNRSNNRT